MVEPHPLQGYLLAARVSARELARRAGIDTAVISRAINGVRPMGRLAAIAISEAMTTAYARGETKVKPLTREQLSPAFVRRAA